MTSLDQDASEQINYHNKAMEALELATWATQPDNACVYIVKRDDGYWAETWLGTKLSANPVRHRTHHGNIGNMSSVRFRATNGAEYYGRYGSDWQQFCRVRKAKGVSCAP